MRATPGRAFFTNKGDCWTCAIAISSSLAAAYRLSSMKAPSSTGEQLYVAHIRLILLKAILLLL